MGAKMIETTKLETVIIEIFGLKSPDDLRNISQEELDRKTGEIIKRVTPKDLSHHTKVIYDRTIDKFNSDLHIREGIIDNLIVFMEPLKEGDRVLDIGCGDGRDTLFMSSSDLQLRASMMQRVTDDKKTIDKYEVPTKTFKVISLDSSAAMLKAALIKIRNNRKSIKNFPLLIQGDMHGRAFSSEFFHGIWSCASLLTHTPQELMAPAVKLQANYLKPKGKFYLSYIRGDSLISYNKFRISSTGNIKYFSQPDPDRVREIAESYGLHELGFATEDYLIQGKLILKNFFASHIFEKESGNSS